ncbi:LuxR family transcriptional regulator [Mycobacterium sp. NPDC051804]|uniref:LuxR family transcriptional regulator n=1 Tax=Mycobacterium sp. NPDC051804 TaxID=3364295 RepID=UPI00379B57E1
MSESSWKYPDIGADMSELPTGTVTLLLADVEGSTRLWETQPEAMKSAVERLDQTLSQAVAAHDGVRPVEQGEGDSFVIAFSRAADAISCALDLQRAPLAPIKLRIGVHTGDVYLRDEGNYIGPTINRTARLRDLAHGGQTVLSGATEALVVDQLPADVTLNDLGSHPLRDLPRPERVVQLCHADLHNDFPPLRTVTVVAAEHLPVQLSRFIGRKAEIRGIREALGDNRLVTLTGAGGAGKTRLAIQVATEIATEFADGAWYVDLAPITDPAVVPVTAARALGLPDQPGQQTMDVLLRFIRDRRILLVLDNCEHLLDATAHLVITLLGACPALTLLTTSREPIGVAGEVSWRVPSMSLADEAIELFADRARRSKPEFRVTTDNTETVTEVCRRLDGLPLAIELAAARVRALSPAEILDSLHDQFRLLTGGSRTAVRRQQTLRASVDWSHALLSEQEQVLFRRLAVFFGGFDIDAAHIVAGDSDTERYQVLDQLTLLVDKSLVVAEDTEHGTRYRLLETVRQYAQEKLHESREGDGIRGRHRDHYAAMAAELDWPNDTGHARRLAQAEVEIDNLRSAFAWCLENSDTPAALRIAASLQPLWFSQWRHREGLAWLDAALACTTSTDADHDPDRVRALADKAASLAYYGFTDGAAVAEEALRLAREIGDPSLVTRALIAHGRVFAHDPEVAGADFLEAGRLARELKDRWRLSQILGWQSIAAMGVGDHVAINATAREGSEVADAIGDGFNGRMCRLALANAHTFRGEVIQAVAPLRDVLAEATAAHDSFCRPVALICLNFALAWQGDVEGAQTAADAYLEYQSDLGELVGYSAIGLINLMTGDAAAAARAYEAALLHTPMTPATISTYVVTSLPLLALGELSAARRRADEVVAMSTSISLVAALASRAYVAIAQGELEQAGLDARSALETAAESHGYMMVPDAFECLAYVTADAGNHREAARLLGAADAARQRNGVRRFKIFESDHDTRIAAIQDHLGENDFRAAWDEGASLSIEETIAYVQRGRGERRRASSGWASLTRAELDVVKLVSEGLGNKDVAARLFVSPRTVQAHLTHVYTKLGLTSRVQLAQEAAKHG